MTTITKGNTYVIHGHGTSRFTGTVVGLTNAFATILITRGRAHATLPQNQKSTGDEVTVIRNLCAFTPITKTL